MTNQAESKMRTRSGAIVAGILLLAAVILGVYIVWKLDTEPRTDDAYAYADTINVAPEVSGRIVELVVKDNQAVKKGDVLFRIDPRPFNEALVRAEATLNALDREIELTQRTVDAQKFAALSAKSAISKARTTAEQAGDTLSRMEPLLDKGYIAAETVDQAKTAKLAADIQLNTSAIDARRAMSQVSGIDALVAQRAVVKSEIALARLNVEYATVHAPFDGLVIGLKTSAGQFAAAGRPVFTLANTTRWYVIANFRETELNHIRTGQSAKVYLLNDPAVRLKGRVESVSYGVFPDDGGGESGGLPNVPRSINWVRVAQRFPVRILVENPDPRLFRIGTSAVAIISADSTDQR